MKKRRLTLNKITVTNLSASVASQIRGGETTSPFCPTWTQDPTICDPGGTSTCPIPCGGGGSGGETCEMGCYTTPGDTCIPCYV